MAVEPTRYRQDSLKHFGSDINQTSHVYETVNSGADVTNLVDGVQLMNETFRLLFFATNSRYGLSQSRSITSSSSRIQPKLKCERGFSCRDRYVIECRRDIYSPH